MILFFAQTVSAKIVISGHVVNDDNVPVDVATTKLVDGNGKILYFQITDENGFFKYVIAETRLEANLIVECLGYDAYKMSVNTDRDLTGVTVRMKTKATELKEVVVTAPSVAVQGDTVSYRLSAFAGKGDVTLKDAMRNLPGIDIADNGKIKYLGKEISNFYIEGMDLLGGRYNVATDNLPVSAVTNVEILNNHQAVKMDKDIFSDNVAINVKLSAKAKFRPIGSYEVKGGRSDDNWLYQLSGAGMVFNSKFQSILNVKYGNVIEFAENANADHNSEAEAAYSAKQLLGNLGLSTPPLERKRFISPTDCFITLNTLRKTGEDATLRANAGYSYTKNSYDYQSVSEYFSEGGSVVFNQDQESTSTVHRPTLSLEYKLNSSERYLTNTFLGNVGIKDNEVASLLNGNSFHQYENVKDALMRNDFSSSWHAGPFRWSVASRLEYGSTPQGYIQMTDRDSEEGFLQSARSHRFLTKETLSSTYQHGRSRIRMPLSVLYVHNAIKSRLDNPAADNEVVNRNARIWFAPQYEYAHPKRLYVIRASANLSWDYNHVANEGTCPVDTSYTRWSVSPNLYVNWALSSASTLRLQTSYSSQLGDVADFLMAPVRTDYLNISYKTGILSNYKSFNAILHYDFKRPLEMWFINADMGYDNSRSNTLTNSNVSDSSIEATSISYPHHSEEVTATLRLTKVFAAIHTKFSVGGAYRWGRGTVSQDEVLRSQYGRAYSGMVRMVAKPWQFIEFDYDGDLTRNYVKYSHVTRSLWSHSHSLKLNLFPWKGAQLKAGADILWKEISEDVSKSMSLLDLGASYKFSSFRVGVDLNNLLNTRHYSYTVFSGINRFSYDYALRGREFLISFMFTR